MSDGKAGSVSEQSNEERVKAVWPDAYAAFLGRGIVTCLMRLAGPVKTVRTVPHGWLIRHGSKGRFLPISQSRRETADEAWEDAARGLFEARNRH